MDMLLEIPAGLHFTEAVIVHAPEPLLSIVRLAEARAKTLVKLTYTVGSHRKSDLFSPVPVHGVQH